MARADYRLCDVCDEKVFYDANLNYSFEAEDGDAFLISGEPQFSNSDWAVKHGLRLERLGDWSVICASCSLTHRTQIVPREEQ